MPTTGPAAADSSNEHGRLAERAAEPVSEQVSEPVSEQVARLAAALEARGALLATAESCTGGMIAAACTDRAGSSAWFERGFVTYSNEAKRELLGVPVELLECHGAVSEPVALAMAEGALRHSHATHAVAVTGVAGPGGGSAAKPVGLVWLAWARRAVPDHATQDGTGGRLTTDPPGSRIASRAQCHRFGGDRAAVRMATVRCALLGLLQDLESDHP